MDKIQDEYSDLPISRQRKWALRNRDRHNEARRRWANTPKGKEYKRKENKIQRERLKGIDNIAEVE